LGGTDNGAKHRQGVLRDVARQCTVAKHALRRRRARGVVHPINDKVMRARKTEHTPPAHTVGKSQRKRDIKRYATRIT